MKKKFPWFFLLLIAVLCALTAVVVPVVTSLRLSSSERIALQNYITSPMERIALEEAKQLDPSYQWIDILDEDSNENAAAYIRSAVSNENQQIYNYFASDSNLSWIVTWNGNTYRHNWKNEYGEDANSTMDMVVSSSSDASVKIRSTLGMDTSDQLFNNMSYITVPEALVPSERIEQEGNEYTYVLHLPADFSIRFYIPARIEANGGRIAEMIYEIGDSSGLTICLLGSSMVLAILILLINKNQERITPIFRQMIHVKALYVWMLLVALLAVGLLGVPALTSLIATGSLRNLLYGEGFSSLQLRWLIPAAAYGSWFALLFVISLAMLYVKYIFAFGLMRYLREDTLMSSLFGRSLRKMEGIGKVEFGNWTWRKVWPLILEGSLFLLLSCGLVYALFGLPLMLLVFVCEVAAVMLIARRMLYLLQKDYQVTVQTAREMAMNQLEIPPRQVGTFQSLYDSLINISQGFQIALKDAITSQNMKTQLISNVSHDLKTPVTGIKTYAELITQTDDLNAIHEYSRRLDTYTERLTSLIQDLFDVARATSGDIQLHPVKINLTELVEQVIVDWEEDLEAKNLSIVTHLIPNAPVEVDTEKIVRVIENLLGNLRKYALQGTRVFVTLQAVGDNFLLVFKNVSATPLDFNPDEITERFTRGDKSRHQTGSGLGLAIVKSFMEVHGGSCTIEVDGDVFKCLLLFPRAKDADPEEPAALLQEEMNLDVAQEEPEQKDSLNEPLRQEQPDPEPDEQEQEPAAYPVLENIMIGMPAEEEDETEESVLVQADNAGIIHPEIPIEALMEAGLSHSEDQSKSGSGEEKEVQTLQN